MADYRKIARYHPAVREFIRNRRWVHRGEAVAYGPRLACDAFSTDGAGYRHSVFKGETLSVSDCVKRERYGLVLGPSNVYGFGVDGNQNTMPSILGELFGFPFANVGLPEGNSRNLFSILLNIASRAEHAPAAVLHISGGDYTGFCYTGIADPVFGSPNLRQMGMAVKERGGRSDPRKQIVPLLAYSTLWMGAIADVCRARGMPLVLGDDTTFFEKREPTDADRDCRLGEPLRQVQERQFAIHKAFAPTYHETRRKFAERNGIPLAGPGLSNQIGFIDEFHYDAAGMRALCEDFAVGIETAMRAPPRTSRNQAASRSTNSG